MKLVRLGCATYHMFARVGNGADHDAMAEVSLEPVDQSNAADYSTQRFITYIPRYLSRYPILQLST